MSPLDLLPGTLFAEDFQILRRLGVGDNGAVFVAEHISTGLQRALKIVGPHALGDQARLSFEREARVGALIESDHIVRVMGAGLDPKTHMAWVAMELLDGVDLAARFADGGPLPREELVPLFEQLCGALGEAHEVGIVHGDLKPTNVFLARPPRSDGAPFDVKVLDFGIARLTIDAAAATAGLIGTPLWMAPEQAGHGGTIVPATDVWALGLLAFRALTGGSYWLAANLAPLDLVALGREVTSGPLENASRRAARLGLLAELPPGFDAWLARCLARESRQRFASAREAHAVLGALLGQGSAPLAARAPAPPPASPPEWLKSTQNRQPTEAEWFPSQGRAAAPSPALAPPTPSGPVAPPRRPASDAAAPSRRVIPAGTLPFARPSRLGLVGLLAAAGLGIGALAWGRPWHHEPITTARAVALPSPAMAEPSMAAPSRPAAGPPVAELDRRNGANRVAGDGARTRLVALAGGFFTPGSRSGASDERPGARTKLAPFALEEHEVTVGDYALCVAAGTCSPPATGNMCLGDAPQHAHRPVNCVSHRQAATYCASIGRRLPSEAEWEIAAAGPAKRAFPWAGPAAPSDGDLCWQRCKTSEGPCDVGSFPGGSTPEGLVDMAGNVWEWTASAYCPYDRPDCGSSSRVTRGGGWCDADPSVFRTTARQANDPSETSANIGFRCAADR